MGGMIHDTDRDTLTGMCLPLLQVSLLCLLICVFGLYALMRKKPRSAEEGGVEYTPAVGNRHFMVRIPWKITSMEVGGRDHHCSDFFPAVPLPSAAHSLALAKVISAASVQVISAVSSAPFFPSFLPPFSTQFVAYLAKTNIIPLQNEEGRTALTPKNQVCVSVTGVSLRDLSYTITTNKWTTYP